jgi:hypothetical protein
MRFGDWDDADFDFLKKFQLRDCKRCAAGQNRQQRPHPQVARAASLGSIDF